MHHILNVALLRGGQIVVEQQEVRSNGSSRSCDFFELAAANESCRIRTVSPRQHFAGDFGPCAKRQIAQYVEGLLSAELWGRRNPFYFRAIARGLRCGGELPRRAAGILQADQERAFLA